MNQEEFYIGQIFNGPYPPEAAFWADNNNAEINEIETLVYEIQKKKVIPHKPTKEEQQEARAKAYAEEIDPLHSRKMRKQILEEWNDEEEILYQEEVKKLSGEIAKRYPYPK